MITVRCLACVVASLTASALGVTIDYTTIGNPGNAPVVFATWFSAARFVNWLSNGQSASAASMENGTYTLNNQTSGAIGFRVAEVQAVPEPASLPLVGG
jgi:hypothetical protein